MATVNRDSVIPTADSWLAQKTTGGTQYGNGTTTLITVGPAQSGSDPSIYYKGRGVFEIPLLDAADGVSSLFASVQSLSVATLHLKVAATTCAARGATQRIFVEQLTGTFAENSPSGNCTISSAGTSDKHWPGPSATTTNRVLFTAAGPATNTVIDVNILALMQAALANGDTVFRFRLIAANSAGDGYDEANTARTVTFYSSKSAGNEPYISITGDTGSATAKAMSLAVNVNMAMTVSSTPLFSVDGEQGVAIANQQNSASHAALNTVSTRDVDSDVLFTIDKAPSGGICRMAVTARDVDNNNYYRAVMQVNTNLSIGLYIEKVVAGVVTVLASLADTGFVFSAGARYHIELYAVGASPTSLKARVWLHVVTTPDWQLTAADSQAALQVADGVGMYFAVTTVSNLPITYEIEEFNTVAG